MWMGFVLLKRRDFTAAKSDAVMCGARSNRRIAVLSYAWAQHTTSSCPKPATYTSHQQLLTQFQKLWQRALAVLNTWKCCSCLLPNVSASANVSTAQVWPWYLGFVQKVCGIVRCLYVERLCLSRLHFFQNKSTKPIPAVTVVYI